MVKKIAAVILCVSAQSAFAGGSYYGFNYGFVDIGLDGASDDAEVGVINARLGTFFNDYISGEIRAGFGVGDDSESGIDVELDSLFGGYLRFGVPNDSVIYPYVLVGLSRVEVSGEGFGEEDSDADGGGSFGVGADISLGESAGVNIEYTSYFHQSEEQVSALSIGASFTF